ncbi:MAG TPA: metal-dependent hydrolase [Bacteroidota bacterium]|nr:metal-dependent hydrolase [Bacteroidota bacterium]
MKHLLSSIALSLLASFVFLGTLIAQPRMIGKGVTVTWYGHAAFKVETAKGKVILIDPWLDNPKAPSSARNIDHVDLILVTHGHSDHLGNTVELAQKFDATVICNRAIALYLASKGVKKTAVLDYSGTYESDKVKIVMVYAQHSSTIEDGGQRIDGGNPAGFIIQCENGVTLYDAGDTGLFGDMKLLAEVYKPDIVMIPIGGVYTMGPREAAKACELLTPRCIIPMHYGTFPALTGTPEELKSLLPIPLKSRVVDILPGDTVN